MQTHKRTQANRRLFLFFLPPYSLHLNIVETFWRILNGSGLQTVCSQIPCFMPRTEPWLRSVLDFILIAHVT